MCGFCGILAPPDRCGVTEVLLRCSIPKLRSSSARARTTARSITTMIETRTDGRPALVSTPLLPPGFTVPASRYEKASTRMRRLLDSERYLFGPGVYDPLAAQLAMYYGFKAVYFSGYSFAMGHLGTTDMDLY